MAPLIIEETALFCTRIVAYAQEAEAETSSILVKNNTSIFSPSI
jgi:hypothetical protein